MKFLIFMTSILTPILSYAMLSNSPENQPRKSITLFNNDDNLILMIKTGDTTINGTKHSAQKLLYGHQQMAISPSEDIVQFTILNKQVETYNIIDLCIGKNSHIKLGDTIRVNYNENKSKIVIVQNDTRTLETLCPSKEPVKVGRITAQMIPIKKRLYLRNIEK